MCSRRSTASYRARLGLSRLVGTSQTAGAGRARGGTRGELQVQRLRGLERKRRSQRQVPRTALPGTWRTSPLSLSAEPPSRASDLLWSEQGAQGGGGREPEARVAGAGEGKRACSRLRGRTSQLHWAGWQ